jgi:hypothetical protein
VLADGAVVGRIFKANAARSVRGQTARRCVTYLTHGDRAPALSILSGGCDWRGARADAVACAVAVGVGGKNELAA